MERGYINVYRKIKDSWIYENSEYFKAWITIIWEVNHKKRNVLFGGEIIECDRGESVKSLSTWCSILGRWWTISKLRTFLNLLQADGKIVKSGSNKTTKITVCNYDIYQDSSQTNDIQIANKSHDDDKQIANKSQQTNIKTLKNKKESILTYTKEKDNELFSLKQETADNFENKSFKQWSEKDFKDSVNQYPEFSKVSESFTGYWTERSATGKMKFTMEKTWETKRRLLTWWKRSSENKFGYKDKINNQQSQEENQFGKVWDYEENER